MSQFAIPREHRVGPTEARDILACSARQLRLLSDRNQISIYRVGTGMPSYDRRELLAIAEASFRPAVATVKTASPTARPRRQTAGSR